MATKGLSGATILVCGGAGFVGSNFIRRILSRHPGVRIMNLDKLTYSGNRANLSDVAGDRRYHFVRGDIADSRKVESVFRQFRPTHVVNFAAETHVDRSIHVGALEFIKTNVEGVFNLLEEVRSAGRVRRFVHVSTDEVYGSLGLKEKKRFRENSPYAPNIPYSATKAGGDHLCRAYHETFGVPVIVTHCSNNYGSYQYPEKLIPFFITRMLDGKRLPLYGDGRNVRDWIYVDDHCRALELILMRGRSGEVYNIGADNERSNLEIAERILKFFVRGREWIEFVTDRPGHDRRYAIDHTKITRELGWKPRADFERRLEETIRWYSGHRDWIEAVRKKTGVVNAHIDLWRGNRRART